MNAVDKIFIRNDQQKEIPNQNDANLLSRIYDKLLIIEQNTNPTNNYTHQKNKSYKSAQPQKNNNKIYRINKENEYLLQVEQLLTGKMYYYLLGKGLYEAIPNLENILKNYYSTIFTKNLVQFSCEQLLRKQTWHDIIEDYQFQIITVEN